MPLFTIIVPVYNSEKYIFGCLESIINQKYKNYEAIVINDSSNDNTKKILKKFKSIGKIRVINNKKRLGVALSRNKGIRKSKGKYIVFLDSDDFLDKNFLKNIQKKINKVYYEVIIVRNRYLEDNKIDKNFILEKKTNTNKSIFEEISDYDKFRTTCWNYVISRNFLFKNNIFFKKLKIFEDQIFVSSLLLFSKKFLLSKNALYIKRNINLNSLSKEIGFSTVISCLKIINEFYNLIIFAKLNSFKIKYINSRIKFVVTQMFNNILICNNNEIRKISSEIRKLKKNFFLLLKKNIFIPKNFKLFLKKNITQTILNYKNQKLDKIRKEALLSKKNKIYLYCAGAYSKITFNILSKYKCNISGVIDDNPYFKNKDFFGVKIFDSSNLDSFTSNKENVIFIICNEKKRQTNKIYENLIKKGFNKKSVIKF